MTQVSFTSSVRGTTDDLRGTRADLPDDDDFSKPTERDATYARERLSAKSHITGSVDESFIGVDKGTHACAQVVGICVDCHVALSTSVG